MTGFVQERGVWPRSCMSRGLDAGGEGDTGVAQLCRSARSPVMPERRARQRADDSAFAGPRSPAPRASGGASGTPAYRMQQLLGDGAWVASYACPLWVSTLFCTFSLPSLACCVRMCEVPHGTLGDRRCPGLLSTSWPELSRSGPMVPHGACAALRGVWHAARERTLPQRRSAASATKPLCSVCCLRLVF